MDTKGYEILRNMRGVEFSSASVSVPGYVWFPDRRKLSFNTLALFVCLVKQIHQKQIQQNVRLKMVELLLKVRKVNLCKVVLLSAADNVVGKSSYNWAV